MNAAARLFSRAQAHPLARFAAVGAIATVIDFGLFSALVLAAGAPAGPANVFSYAASLVANFNLNRRWTFRQRKDAKTAARQGGRFLVAYGGGLMLSTAVVVSLAALMPELWAKIVSVPIVFVYNYACARLWVYREAAASKNS